MKSSTSKPSVNQRLADALEGSRQKKNSANPLPFRSAHKQRVAAAIRAEHQRPRGMKTLTVRLPVSVVAEIERESQTRRVSKSDVVRERLHQPKPATGGSMMDLCGDLLGSVRNDGLPADLSSNKKKYLPNFIRAEKHHR